jgi:hypothetical protein
MNTFHCSHWTSPLRSRAAASDDISAQDERSGRKALGAAQPTTDSARLTLLGLALRLAMAASFTSVVSPPAIAARSPASPTQGATVTWVAFESSASGNTFINAGAISGSVTIGAASNNFFTAVTGSSISAGGGTAGSKTGTPGVYNLSFAPAGQTDGGTGGTNTLLLQNPIGVGGGISGTGTASSTNYVNFTDLTVNSGTWTLQGRLVSGSTTLNGGSVRFDITAVPRRWVTRSASTPI